MDEAVADLAGERIATPVGTRPGRHHVDVAVEQQARAAARPREPCHQLRPAGEGEALRHVGMTRHHCGVGLGQRDRRPVAFEPLGQEGLQRRDLAARDERLARRGVEADQPLQQPDEDRLAIRDAIAHRGFEGCERGVQPTGGSRAGAGAGRRVNHRRTRRPEPTARNACGSSRAGTRRSMSDDVKCPSCGASIPDSSDVPGEQTSSTPSAGTVPELRHRARSGSAPGRAPGRGLAQGRRAAGLGARSAPATIRPCSREAIVRAPRGSA